MAREVDYSITQVSLKKADLHSSLVWFTVCGQLVIGQFHGQLKSQDFTAYKDSSTYAGKPAPGVF